MEETILSGRVAKLRERLYKAVGDDAQQEGDKVYFFRGGECHSLGVYYYNPRIQVELGGDFSKITDTRGPTWCGIPIPQIAGASSHIMSADCTDWGSEEFQEFERMCIDRMRL